MDSPPRAAQGLASPLASMASPPPGRTSSSSAPSGDASVHESPLEPTPSRKRKARAWPAEAELLEQLQR